MRSGVYQMPAQEDRAAQDQDFHASSSIARLSKATHSMLTTRERTSPQEFKAQTQFFKRGTRARHTDDDIEEYEQRREQIRQLFAELEELQKVA